MPGMGPSSPLAAAHGPWSRLAGLASAGRPARLDGQFGAASPRAAGSAAAPGVAIAGAVPMAVAFLGPGQPGWHRAPPSAIVHVTGQPNLGAL